MVYIFLCAIAGYISGAPIYYRNKIKYLKERGWTVYVFPIYDGKIYISGLEEYTDRAYPFLDSYINEYSKKERNKLLEKMACEIPKADKIIIETGSDYTAYWGELLAKRLGARHFCFLLDEKNPRITRDVLPFYDFKYKRHELACITKDTIKKYFDGYMDIPDDKAYSLKAVCTNSTEDFESPITDKIITGDYNIGYIGRPSISFFGATLDGVLAFSKEVSPKKVSFTVFGGDDEEVLEGIRNRCKEQKNLDLFITGYMFPFPEKAILKHDMFISGAGSRFVSSRLGVPTLSMDVYHNRPIKLVEEYLEPLTSEENCNKSVLDFINQVLIEKRDIPKNNFSPVDWDYVCNEFDEHMDFLSKASNDLNYLPVESLPLNSKQKVFKLARKVLTSEGFEKLRDKKRGVK